MTGLLARLIRADRVQAFVRAARSLGPVEFADTPIPGAITGTLPDGSTWWFHIPGVETAVQASLGCAFGHLLASEHEIDDLTRELSTMYEEITLLYRLGTAFSGMLQLDQIQRTIIDEVADTLEVGKVTILTLTDDRNGLVMAAGKGVDPATIGHVRFTRPQGLPWQVIDQGTMLLSNAPAALTGYIPGTTPDRSLLMVPVAAKAGVIGVLAVANRLDGGDFSSKDEKLLSSIAHHMGTVWENARLYQEARELFLNTVEALSAAIDAKDPYTHGHSRRVTDFSVAIAVELGLSTEDIERIRISALLHDIGKLGVSEFILRKPDRLTNEEFDEIKKHPVIGAEIMGHIRKLSQFVPGMVDHHERFGGGGYPEGRCAENISMAGRIIAVADTFDAITSNRPYHPDQKGKPDDVGIAEIKRCQGSHYDPQVVEAFLRAYERGAIRQDRTLQSLDF